MSLKVIGAALPRTGTVSLKVALEMLGFGRCYHMSELILHPEHAPLWAEAPERPENFEAIFAGYQAITDFPGSALWRELADYYPLAKVILTRRNPDKWFESVRDTIGRPAHFEMMSKSPLAPVVERFTMFGPDPDDHADLGFGPEPDDRAAATRYFREYGDAVQAAIPPERLLVFEAKDGWEPLCAFLEVAVPEMPYPRLNDRETMQGAGAFEDLSFEQVRDRIRTALGR